MTRTVEVSPDLAGLIRWEREEFESATDDARRQGAARALVSTALLAVGDIVGDDALRVAYGESPAPDADRSEHLNVLADRLWLLSAAFPQDGGEGDSSLLSAVEELRAIAAGDAPRLFRRPETTGKRPINAYRIASHQLRALVWDRFLKACGNSAHARHRAIAEAYGQEWPTIYQWGRPVIRELGQARYDRAMADAERKRPRELGGLSFRSHKEAIERLNAHGEAYRQELRARVQIA